MHAVAEGLCQVLSQSQADHLQATQPRTTTMQDHEANRAPSATEFIEHELRRNPKASFAEVKARAEQLGILLPPFLYGQARQRLELEANPGDNDSKRKAEPEQPPASDPSAAANEPQSPQSSPGDHEPPQSGFEFAVHSLRMTPEITFQDLKARAEMAGFKLPPIVYGRAKALLGLVPTKPRKRKQSKGASDPFSTGSAQPIDNTQSVEHLIKVARELHRDREQLRQALREVLQCVEEALDE